MTKRHYRKKGTRGSALLLVLFAVGVTAMILAVSIPVADVAALSSASHNDRIINFYLAESTISRAQIMLMNDYVGYTTRTTMSQLMSEDAATKFYEESEKNNETRLLADGSQHTLTWDCFDFEADCNFTLSDANSNYNFSGTENELMRRLNEYGNTYDLSDSEEGRLEFKKMTNQILDYVDIDNQRREDGMEVGDYLGDPYNLPGLPRNGAFATIEELCWIPLAAQLMVKFDENGFFSNLRNGLSRKLSKKFSSLANAGSSLAGSDDSYIRSMMGLNVRDAEKLERYAAAYKQYRTDGTPLYDSLDASDLSAMKRGFSDKESGLYSLTVTGATSRHPSPRTIKVSFVINPNDQPNNNLTYMRHYFYWITY